MSLEVEFMDVETTEVPDSDRAQTLVATAAPATKALAEFDVVKASMAELALIISGTSYDIETREGEATARDLRSRCVKLRTGVEALYEERNKPMLAIQRGMRTVKAEIEAGIEPHEKKLDTAIKAKEARIAAEKARLAAIEMARIQGIRDRITDIAKLPAAAVKLDSAGIGEMITGLDSLATSGAPFDEFQEEAESLISTISAQLGEMRGDKALQEAEAVRLEAERSELLRLRQELADREAAAAKRLKDEADAAAAAARAAQAERDERQAQADADFMNRSQELKRQQDAFEAEKLAETERRRQQDLEAKAREDKIRADAQALEESLKPKPTPAPTPMPTPAPTPVPTVAPVVSTLSGKPGPWLRTDNLVYRVTDGVITDQIDVICASGSANIIARSRAADDLLVLLLKSSKTTFEEIPS
jgi:hypothetical protein